MLQIPAINNPLERECIEYATNYIPLFVNLYRKTMNEYERYRRDWDNLIIVQPPYRNSNSEVRYNDWSIISNSKDIDIRFEISSLKPDTTLRAKALEHVMQSKNIPENQLVLILIGEGYDNIMVEVNNLIYLGRYPVTVIRSINEYRNYIDNVFSNSNRMAM